MKKIIFGFCFSCTLLCRAQHAGTYTNPVLAGFYPDPSICRVGDDYYIVNSSFAYYPGLPVFHSRDLASWKQIGSAMNRPEQLNVTGAGVSRGLFAPAIRHYKGLYYIVCTLIDKGGNFVITAKNPAGPWSNPVWLKNVDGIDPSLFFDEETGKAYILYNSVPPDNKPLWDGHRTIRMRSFDSEGLQAADDEKIIVNGGTDVSKKPVWIEGPHIYKVNGWYYLLCAEGGTGYNHSEVVFRSKNVDGPYISYQGNPILTQRHLDPSRPRPVTTTGHADLVQTKDGKWYAVFLGCRPYEDDHYNIGRETFLAPVTWTADGWPVITKGLEEVRYFYPLPPQKSKAKPQNPFTGNFVFRDEFLTPLLNNRYSFLRTVTTDWYNTTERKGFLALRLQPETVSGKGNPSFTGFRQANNVCTATTALFFAPEKETEKAGLIIFQNEHHFYYLCKSVENSKPVVQVFRATAGEEMELLASQPLPATHQKIFLRILADKAVYTLQYSTDNKKWVTLKQVDGKFLSTKTAGGFVGSLFGLYATSTGKQSGATAFFDWFAYTGNDDVYK